MLRPDKEFTQNEILVLSRVPEKSYGFRKRLAFVYQEIERDMAGDGKPYAILDIGCGTGDLLTVPLGSLLESRDVSILGIDLHLPSIEHAQRLEGRKLSFACMSLEELGKGFEFDFIICSEVLEHLAEPERMLASIKGRLKPGGKCVITVPNGYGPFEIMTYVWKVAVKLRITAILKPVAYLLVRRRGNVSGQSQKHDTLNPDSPHLQHFTLARLRRLIETSGLAIVQRRHRTFLCGPFLHLPIDRSERLRRLNASIADRLPSFLVSGWMFVVEHK